MTSVSITLARAEHLASIPAIELAGAALFSAKDLPQTIRHRVTDPSDLRDAMKAGRLWMAVNDNRPVGFAMAEVVDEQAYLTEIDVHPEFGRRGIGSGLVREVVAWARDSGFSSLSLITFKHLSWNAPFYEKLGFSAMNPAEHGPGLAGLILEESRIGIDTSNRVAMKLNL